jgi:tRNA(Ser,Leu) C12 N-acetylase TAN1
MEAQVIASAKSLLAGRKTLRALRRALPDAYVHGLGFRGLFLVEAPGDALELAAAVSRIGGGRVAHARAALAEVESAEKPVQAAAVDVARRHVGRGESFCVRVHKRGRHALSRDTPALERDLGAAIWQALRERDGEDPKVELDDPDLTLTAEVLGPLTSICIERREWRAEPAPESPGAQLTQPALDPGDV